MTHKEFYDWINNLPSRVQPRDLEEYLSALYYQVKKNQDKELTIEKLLMVIEKSFTSEAIEFNTDWLMINDPPEFDANEVNLKLSLNEEIAFTIDVIKFQVSELHKMRDKQLKNELRYFGTTSEAGHPWFNFDPFNNLECGAAWLLNRETENQEMNVNWRMLGILLEMGRIYE